MSSFADLYGGLLKLYERRMRPPFTLEHFTMMIAALSEGFVLQMLSGMEHPHVELDSGDPDVGSTWTLMAAAVDAFVTTFTEPETGAPTR